MKLFLKTVKIWLPLVVIVTLLSGLIYVVAQQMYRQSANDPQIQMAEDIAKHLDSGQSVNSAVGTENVDIRNSLSTYITIYDSSYKVVASSGNLEGQAPTVPTGVLENAKDGVNRVTWQPEEGVRVATVTQKYKDGFVTVGRNMKEIEVRVDNLGKTMLLGWFVTMVASLIAVIACEVVYNRLTVRK